MPFDADVIIIGAGAGGPVVAKELGEKGIKVVMFEAGPWYGNEKWPYPNSEPGALSSSSFEDLSHKILDRSFNDYEDNMNDLISGRFRWGPADRSKPPWFRDIPMGGFTWQNSGVGGTTLHYFGNSPRAYPHSVDGVWPISYNEMIPFYEKVEATLPVLPAPVTSKDELFFYGAKSMGWPLLKTPDVTSPGYRSQPAAILHPGHDINDPNYKFVNPHPVGCTLRGHCINGCHMGPDVDKTAKRSTLVSYVPLALETGNVEIRPNTFVIRIITEKDAKEGLHAIGVMYRNTWTGEIGELRAKSIVMAAGAIETPRLWLNSGLPYNPWVGKGLSSHWFDCVSGIFDERDLVNLLGSPHTLPFVGQTSGARFDYPGLGMILVFGMSPGLFSSLLYGLSESGYGFMNSRESGEPWDIRGRVVGTELKELMEAYPRTLSTMIIIDDDINQNNGVTLNPGLRDENGFIPVVRYEPSKEDEKKRDQLSRISAEIMRKAGAKKIIRSDWPRHLFIHLVSTMRIGLVTDLNCEAIQVKRLFIADNSVLYNSLGGPNPTLTNQTLAARTAEKLAIKYFS